MKIKESTVSTSLIFVESTVYIISISCGDLQA